MTIEFFGKTLDGRDAHVYTLCDGASSVRLTDYGATVLSFIFDGVDIVGGFDRLDTYFTDDSHQGAIIGRVANRIANARFTMDGKEYSLPKNNGENCLHGGVGFDFKLWEVKEYDEKHIVGAVLLPVGMIDEDTAEAVIPQKDTVVLVYCRSGNRSKTASETLVQLGYTQVYEFGGINQWPYETE